MDQRHQRKRSRELGSGDRAYARVAEHYLATGRTELARSAAREAAAIRDLLVAGDAKSPAVVNFRRRVDALDTVLNAP